MAYDAGLDLFGISKSQPTINIFVILGSETKIYEIKFCFAWPENSEYVFIITNGSDSLGMTMRNNL